jgi:hypothetical protein
MRTFAYSGGRRRRALSVAEWRRHMNKDVGHAQIGQWYLHRDKGEIFQVIGRDEAARTIEIQTFGGDLDEIDEETWGVLPLGLAEPPEDWTGPVDDVERDDLGYSETDMRGADWAEPLGSHRPLPETWQDTTEEEESTSVSTAESAAEVGELARVTPETVA